MDTRGDHPWGRSAKAEGRQVHSVHGVRARSQIGADSHLAVSCPQNTIRLGVEIRAAVLGERNHGLTNITRTYRLLHPVQPAEPFKFSATREVDSADPATQAIPKPKRPGQHFVVRYELAEVVVD